MCQTVSGNKIEAQIESTSAMICAENYKILVNLNKACSLSSYPQSSLVSELIVQYNENLCSFRQGHNQATCQQASSRMNINQPIIITTSQSKNVQSNETKETLGQLSGSGDADMYIEMAWPYNFALVLAGQSCQVKPISFSTHFIFLCILYLYCYLLLLNTAINFVGLINSISTQLPELVIINLMEAPTASEFSLSLNIGPTSDM